MQRALLSININKYALLRNARGRGIPDLLEAADRCIAAGAHGITVHPRLDERHVRMADIPLLKHHLARYHPQIELNIECQDDASLIDLVLEMQPTQCTLVPVRPGEVTSDRGFSFPNDHGPLTSTIRRLHNHGIRTSIFMDCTPDAMAAAAATGTDRVELYTGPYAWAWGTPSQASETQHVWETAAAARRVGLGLNAGHDLDRDNLSGLVHLPELLEVSIGHAQVCRALEVGTTQSVRELLTALGY